MSAFLGPLFVILVAGGFFFSTVIAIAACARSGQISREEQYPICAKIIQFPRKGERK